jgi:hypothetical protein
MSPHLGDLLDDARQQRFVGRGHELSSFDGVIDGRSPRRVLFVHGPGGIGKTTLLTQFGARARAAGRDVVHVDGREVDPSAEGMETAVRVLLDQPRGDRPLAQLLTGAVLLVDGYEQLTPIDGWLRNELVPGLSADSVVVLAGRDAPTAPWLTDPGWHHLVVVHHLKHFDRAESGELLAHAGVVAPVRPHLVTLGRGHPLTIALLADLAAYGQVPDTLADAPDLISTLLESFLRDVPDDAHLTGLATCAIAWVTTEDLLDRMIGAEAATVWQWLARRPFITTSPHGLSPHDLARDVLDAEFGRRAPERYRSYHRAIHDHVVSSLRAATGLDRQRQAQHLLFLLRRSPFPRTILALRAHGSATVVPARRDEHDLVCSIIERFEGPTSAELARGWLDEQPDHLSVVRTDAGIAGFAYHVLLPSSGTMQDRDPVVRAVLDHIAREGPIRPGERVDIIRFCAGARDHQRDLYSLLAAYVSSLVEWLTKSPAWWFLIAVDTEHIAPFTEYLAVAPLIETDVGDLRHVAFGVDGRRFPFEAWLELMRERGHSGETGPPPAALLRPPPLDRNRFGAAVKAALQILNQPEKLTANPLLGSALAATSTGPDTDQLRHTIEAAIISLGTRPRGERLRAVLHRTYVRAAPTQEAAAEVLDLPLSTYRRYLAKALDQLTDLLWSVEIGDAPLPGTTAGRDE